MYWVTSSLDRDEFLRVVAELGVEPSVAESALENLLAGRVVFLLASGLMGAGKDTLPPLVLERLGRSDAFHLYYADALKAEADAMFARIRQAGSSGEASAVLVSEFGVPEQFASPLVDVVWADLGDSEVHARSRTPGVRAFLQLLGSDVRRAQDPDYWVRIAARSAVEQLAAGRDVFVTDARFPNEVVFATALGGFAVRLEVSRATQLERLFARDGVLPEEGAFAHMSETALDSFEGFSLVVDNNGSVEDGVRAIVDGWQAAGLRVPV